MCNKACNINPNLIFNFFSAALASKNNEITKKRFTIFDNENGQTKALDESQQAIINADSLAQENDVKYFK